MDDEEVYTSTSIPNLLLVKGSTKSCTRVTTFSGTLQALTTSAWPKDRLGSRHWKEALQSWKHLCKPKMLGQSHLPTRVEGSNKAGCLSRNQLWNIFLGHVVWRQLWHHFSSHSSLERGLRTHLQRKKSDAHVIVWILHQGHKPTILA